MTTAFDFGTHLANIEPSSSPPPVTIYVQYDDELSTLRWSTNNNKNDNDNNGCWTKVPFGKFFVLESKKIKTEFESVKLAATTSAIKFNSNRLEQIEITDNEDGRSSIGPFAVINYRHVRHSDFLLRIESIHVNLEEAKKRADEISRLHHTALLNLGLGCHNGSPIGAVPLTCNYNGNYGVKIEEEIEEESNEIEEEIIEEESNEISSEIEDEISSEIIEEESNEIRSEISSEISSEDEIIESRALTPPPEIY